jgi:hypothetical protein
MEYLCHKWPRIFSVWRNQNPVLSSFITYRRLCNKCNTMDISRVEQELLSLNSAPDFTRGFSGARSLVFCVLFCRSLFGLLSCFLVAFLLSILPFTESDCCLGIFKLFSFDFVLVRMWIRKRSLHLICSFQNYEYNMIMLFDFSCCMNLPHHELVDGYEISLKWQWIFSLLRKPFLSSITDKIINGFEYE